MSKKTSKTVERESGSFAAAEDVGTKLLPSDLLLGRMLDGRPIDGIEKGSIVQPVRNQLLAHAPGLTSVAEEFGHARRKGGLPVGELHCSPKRDNVVFLHGSALYKRACNLVNKPARMTVHKATCTVLAMAVAHRKKPLSPKPKKDRSQFQRGADGRTANERFRDAFATWSSSTKGTQMDLVRQCNVVAGRPPDAEKDYVSQQIIDQISRDKIDASRSQFLDVLAEALGVRAVWLRLGVGQSKPDRAVIDHLREVLRTTA